MKTFIRYKLVKERVQDFLKQKYNVSDIPINKRSYACCIGEFLPIPSQRLQMREQLFNENHATPP